MRKHKYNAKPTIVDGIRFASKREAKRYGELKLLQKAGVISNLELQPKFELLPKDGKQRAINYVGDFRYTDNGFGLDTVEDVKGFATQAFKLKAKWFRAMYPDICLKIIK